MAADRITVLFTRRRFNPVSWLIRWAVPRSRFSLALSSHCLVDAGDKLYEAHMWYGVREVDRSTAMKGLTVVKITDYQVPDAAAGIAWIKSQLCTYVPPPKPRWMPQAIWSPVEVVLRMLHSNYDWNGALGLGLTPYRDWTEDDLWFCFELIAGALRAAGRPVFANLTHVGETALMSINP